MHWGLQKVPHPGPGEGYGKKTCKEESVSQNFAAGKKVGVAEYMNSRGEAIYQSTRLEPLGKSLVRGHDLPAVTRDVASFRGFGIPSTCDISSKECIWPRNIVPETEEAKTLYRKTHGSFDPGEVYRREYDWPNVVKENPTFRFGTVDGADTSNRGTGAKGALCADRQSEPLSVLKTEIVTGVQESFRKVGREHLGTSKSLLQGKAISTLPPDYVYGCPTANADISVGELIRGFYPDADQLPDEDLGCCVVKGKRNFHTQTALGVPTVRTDLPLKPQEKRSVTNTTNFGDDASACHLIYPGKFQFRGVSNDDFGLRRTPDGLRSVLTAAGYDWDDADFAAVFSRACELHGDGEPLASAGALLFAYQEQLAGQ